MGADGDSRLVWFMQNDDHPFVDVDTDVLCEGLARMRRDPSRFITLGSVSSIRSFVEKR